MKIAIISNVDIKHMSLISIYTNFFVKNNIDFDIINASEKQDESQSHLKNIFTFQHNENRNKNRILNFLNNIKYKQFVKKRLQENNYDFLIVWRSEVGFLFYNLLASKYRNKYIINIRDYAGENIAKYRLKQEVVVENSRLNVISSKGFLSFLPKGDYVYRHSLNDSLSNDLMKVRKHRFASTPIHIGFIGNVRFFREDIRLLEALKNDSRYIVQFFGTGSDKLEEYAKKEQITNCEFVGKFSIEDTPKLLSRIDIINNIFGNESISVSTLVSIRYYHSLMTKKPFIANKNTYMGTLTDNNEMGFEFDGDYSNLADNLYEWYTNLNYDSYSINVDKKLVQIYEDNQQLNGLLQEIFSEK